MHVQLSPQALDAHSHSNVQALPCAVLAVHLKLGVAVPWPHVTVLLSVSKKSQRACCEPSQPRYMHWSLPPPVGSHGWPTAESGTQVPDASGPNPPSGVWQ